MIAVDTDQTPAPRHRVRIVFAMSKPQPLNSDRPAEDTRDDLSVDHHLRGTLALSPTPQRFQICGVRLWVGLNEGNKLGCRELVPFDPAQNVFDGWGEEVRDGVDTVGSIERWFSWRVPGGHKSFIARGPSLVNERRTSSTTVRLEVR